MPDSATQRIVCCMGQPVAGNPTQFMMERAFAAARLDWRYLTLEVPPEDLENAMLGMRAMGFSGANFTIPHKVAVIQFLDGLSEAAELMGAVNCVNRQGDQLIGENTDGKGFVQALKECTDPQGKRVAIFGAGGAARAIAVELGLNGASAFTIINRSQERGQDLVQLLSERVNVEANLVIWEDEQAVPQDADLVINATSIGLGDASARVPIDAHSFQKNQVVADVIFNPADTQFLEEAQSAGCTIIDGLGMLVNQGVIGFKIWTGVDPDAAVMREALEEFLEL